MQKQRYLPLLTLGLVVTALALVGAVILAFKLASVPDFVPDLGVNVNEGSTSTNPSQPQAVLKLQYVADAEARKAVCNDGSPASYYFRPGTETNKDKWVIYFKGGGGCGDEASCLKRAQQDSHDLMSSKGLAPTKREDGIFLVSESKNPDFYAWNHVYMNYCSSDIWSGTSQQQVGNETWNFYGKYIVQAIFEDLKNPEIISTATLADASEVLVAGSSAGSEGVANNLDLIAEGLPGVKIKGLLDSNWQVSGLENYAEVPQFAGRSRAENTRMIHAWRQTEYDESCQLAHSTDPSPCSHQAVTYPYLDTPVFVYESQFDNLKLTNLGLTAPFDSDEQAWIDQVFLPSLMGSYAQVEDGLFSPQANFHTLVTRPQYYSTQIDGISFQEVFTNWYFERGGTTRLVEGE